MIVLFVSFCHHESQTFKADIFMDDGRDALIDCEKEAKRWIYRYITAGITELNKDDVYELVADNDITLDDFVEFVHTNTSARVEVRYYNI